MPYNTFNQQTISDELKTAIYKLQSVRQDDSKLLYNFFTVLEETIKNFELQKISFYHLEQNEKYQDFIQSIIDTLAAKMDFKGAYYNFHEGKCVEALILQQLAKMRIPQHSKTRNSITTRYTSIIETLILSAQHYFNRTLNPRKPFLLRHAIFLLNALTRLNMNPYNKVTANSIKGLPSIKNNPLVSGLLQPIQTYIINNLKTIDAPELIRYLHSVILLSDEQDGFRTYLPQQDVLSIFDRVQEKLAPLDATNPEHIALAQQLLQIRNVFPEFFPDALSHILDPFINLMDQNTHGSNFENKIYQMLQMPFEKLSLKYPGLINKDFLNNNNPINVALGIESDITYENGIINASLQVDGDKYHKYCGTNSKTQRTKLRDFSFQQNDWKTIIFTDKECDESFALTELTDKIVLPTYDALTKIAADFQFQQEEFAATNHRVNLVLHNETLTQHLDYNYLQHVLYAYQQYNFLFEQIDSTLKQIGKIEPTNITATITELKKAIADKETTINQLCKSEEKLEQTKDELEKNLSNTDNTSKESITHNKELKRNAKHLSKVKQSKSDLVLLLSKDQEQLKNLENSFEENLIDVTLGNSILQLNYLHDEVHALLNDFDEASLLAQVDEYNLTSGPMYLPSNSSNPAHPRFIHHSPQIHQQHYHPGFYSYVDHFQPNMIQYTGQGYYPPQDLYQAQHYPQPGMVQYPYVPSQDVYPPQHYPHQGVVEYPYYEQQSPNDDPRYAKGYHEGRKLFIP